MEQVEKGIPTPSKSAEWAAAYSQIATMLSDTMGYYTKQCDLVIELFAEIDQLKALVEQLRKQG